MRKKKVKAHIRVVAGMAPMSIPQHVRVSFSADSKSGKLRPSVFGIGSPSEAEQAAKIIASFDKALKANDN